MSAGLAVKSRAKTARILVVDDDAGSARLLSFILTRQGYDVCAVHSADAALEIAEAEPFDLVISDISMPEKDGWQLMQELRARHFIPGIAFSAFDQPGDRTHSRAAGFAAHLTKPVDIDVLLKAVRRALLSNSE